MTATDRRYADRLRAEGAAVASTFAEQDRLDPTRPTLGQLVAEALAAAERRGELRVIDGRDIALAALADLVAAVDDLLRRPADGTPRGALTAARDRAHRHLRPTGDLS